MTSLRLLYKMVTGVLSKGTEDMHCIVWLCSLSPCFSALDTLVCSAAMVIILLIWCIFCVFVSGSFHQYFCIIIVFLWDLVESLVISKLTKNAFWSWLIFFQGFSKFFLYWVNIKLDLKSMQDICAHRFVHVYGYFLDTQKNGLIRLTCKNEWSLYDYSGSKQQISWTSFVTVNKSKVSS